MEIIDEGTDKERIQCRVRIEGTLEGQPFVYEDPEGSPGSQFIWVKENYPSEYWWTEGNFGCDCNRGKFVPAEMQDKLVPDGEGGFNCGERIMIDRIIPIEGGDLPELHLNESMFGK